MQDMTVHEIERLLDESRIGRLSMADRDGRPYTIPMPFCWSDGTIYLRLPLAGRKGSILSENDQVCFEVDQFTETLDEYASVLIEGRLIPVIDTDEKLRVKFRTDEKYSRLRRGYRPGHGRSTTIEQLPLRKIVVECISGRKKESQSTAALVAATGN